MMSNLQSQVAELKSQGVAEAARDPESNVTAQDAEKSFVDETKKAGGLAFNFNPDASPEEKANQARAVRYLASWPSNAANLSTCSTYRRIFTVSSNLELWALQRIL